MFSKLSLLFLFAFSSPLVWADAGSGESEGSNDQEKQSFLQQLPFISEFASMMQNFPGFGGLSGLGGSRHERSIENEEAAADNEEHQSRFFFSLFPSIVSCNYTTNPGRSCASCTQSLVCLRNNVGIQRNCRGLFPYCNGGRCSRTQSTACSGSSVTAAPTTVAPTTVAPTTV